MKATDVLMAEHEVILRVISALEKAADRLEQGAAIRPAFFADSARFIKGFADGCHHKKEEGVLFEAMEAHGMPGQAGPIGVMLVEHARGRIFTRDMADAARRWEAGDQSACAEIIKNARGYAELLRQHIAKENGMLFPMADQVIPPSEQAWVYEDFERVEHEETGVGVHEKYLALAAALEKEVSA